MRKLYRDERNDGSTSSNKPEMQRERHAATVVPTKVKVATTHSAPVEQRGRTDLFAYVEDCSDYDEAHHDGTAHHNPGKKYEFHKPTGLVVPPLFR